MGLSPENIGKQVAQLLASGQKAKHFDENQRNVPIPVFKAFESDTFQGSYPDLYTLRGATQA